MIFTFENLNSNGIDMEKKETITRWNLIGFQDDKFIELITARWYMGRSATSSVVYCTVWLHSPLLNNSSSKGAASGSGQASGGGYCKSSAAFKDALYKAGIKCDQGISGRGMNVVAGALNALGKQCGFDKIMLVKD